MASLNLCWDATNEQRARQRVALVDGDFDVVLLQEARRVDLPALADGFEWCEHSLSSGTHSKVLGTAILGRNGTKPVARHQLERAAFTGDDMYDDLTRWYVERHLAVDVALVDGPTVRMLSAHATPGSSKGPGSPKRGVQDRKRWFHTHLARWVATWADPFVFAIDANTPRVDTLDWATTEFWVPSADDGLSGEDVLLGAPGVRGHLGHDLWREWLDSPAGAGDRAAVPTEGPLARSHQTKGGAWFRYDHLYGSDSVHPTAMSYVYDAGVSDHALVSANLTIS